MDILLLFLLLYCYCDRHPSIQSNGSRSFICVKYIHFTRVDLFHLFQRYTINLPFGRNGPLVIIVTFSFSLPFSYCCPRFVSGDHLGFVADRSRMKRHQNHKWDEHSKFKIDGKLFVKKSESKHIYPIECNNFQK